MECFFSDLQLLVGPRNGQNQFLGNFTLFSQSETWALNLEIGNPKVI